MLILFNQVLINKSSRVVNILISLILMISSTTYSQETTKKTVSLEVSADIVSSYIWRGIIASPTLNFQPKLALNTGKFEFGFWGSVDNLNYIREMDLFFTYSLKNLSFTVSDYYWDTGNSYFDYKSISTSHIFELGLTYKINNFPLQIYASTMLYGNDKLISYDTTQTSSTKNNFSTYFELSYMFSIEKNKLNVFIGATPFTGFYGKDFSVVFMGITGRRRILITDKFSTAIFVTFAANPQTQNYFTILGVSF